MWAWPYRMWKLVKFYNENWLKTSPSLTVGNVSCLRSGWNLVYKLYIYIHILEHVHRWNWRTGWFLRPKTCLAIYINKVTVRLFVCLLVSFLDAIASLDFGYGSQSVCLSVTIKPNNEYIANHWMYIHVKYRYIEYTLNVAKHGAIHIQYLHIEYLHWINQ